MWMRLRLGRRIGSWEGGVMAEKVMWKGLCCTKMAAWLLYPETNTKLHRG